MVMQVLFEVDVILDILFERDNFIPRRQLEALGRALQSPIVKVHVLDYSVLKWKIWLRSLTTRENIKELFSYELLFNVCDSQVEGLELDDLCSYVGRHFEAVIALNTAVNKGYDAIVTLNKQDFIFLIQISKKSINERRIEIYSIDEFLRKFDSIEYLENLYTLDNNRVNTLSYLSDLQQEIMYWLAINRELLSSSDLEDDILSDQLSGNLQAGLESLRQLNLIQRIKGKYTQRATIMRDVISQFIADFSREFIDFLEGRLDLDIVAENLLINKYFLKKSLSNDSIKEKQQIYILQPVIYRIQQHFRNRNILIDNFKRAILTVRNIHTLKTGYIGGNIVNLLRELDADLTSSDFSNLTLSQADFTGVPLPSVNFANSDLSKSIFTQIFSSPLSVAFSPDGKFLAFCDTNGDVHLWEVSDSKQILTLKGHIKGVWSVAFSPDGSKLASGGDDNIIKLWNTKTGECEQNLYGHISRIWTLAFSPDGQTLASGSNDNRILLWDVSNINGKSTREIQNKSGVNSVVFYPKDNKFLFSGDESGEVKVWNITTGRNVLTLDKAHKDHVWSVAVRSDGQYLASGSKDGTLKLWKWDSKGKKIKIEFFKELSKHNKAVEIITFSLDNLYLASCSDDKTVKLWKVDTGELSKTLLGHSGIVHSVAFSPDSKILATASNDKSVRLWEWEGDTGNTGQCFKILQGHANLTLSVAFSPDNRILATGSSDQNVRLRNISDESVRTLEHANQVQAIAFSSNGLLASGSENGVVKLWDVSTWQLLRNLSAHDMVVWVVAFSPDGQILATGSGDGTVKLWQTSTGRNLHSLNNETGQIWSVTFSPDGRIVASGSDDGKVVMWDSMTGVCLHSLKGDTVQVGQVGLVAFSPDGNTLVTTQNKTVKLWDVNTGKSKRKEKNKFTQEHEVVEVAAFAFNSDGQIIVSVIVSDRENCNDKILIRLLDIKGKLLDAYHLENPLERRISCIWKVAFSQNGRFLASTRKDGKIDLWDVQERKFMKCLKDKLLYEGMNIKGVKGLTVAQKDKLKVLGAVEEER